MVVSRRNVKITQETSLTPSAETLILFWLRKSLRLTDCEETNVALRTREVFEALPSGLGALSRRVTLVG